MKRLLRWGILGTANIARKNWKAIALSGNGRVVAVASRDRRRAESFIRDCQAEVPFPDTPRACGSYSELVDSDDVDAIYLPLPTGVRSHWVRQAAQAGKHVLCEKPCAANAAELQEMMAVCARHRVQFMDGVMFLHSRRLQRLRELLDARQVLGDLRRITSAFSFCASDDFFTENVRARSELEPAGCLGDLGWYCLGFSLWAAGKLPSHVTGRILASRKHPASAAPVPVEFSGEMFFPGDLSAGFYCSFLTADEQWVMLTGKRGWLRISDFVLPFSAAKTTFETAQPEFAVRGCDFQMHANHRSWELDEPSQGHSDAQESRMFRHFAEAALSGNLCLEWAELALRTQTVMDACLQSAREDSRSVPLPPGPKP